MVVKILGGALTLTIILLTASLLPSGEVTVGSIENIHGIPYPQGSGHIAITEPLAHADISLEEPVLAKKLELTITYHPINLTSLAVGVREDSFWLSYASRQEIYRHVDSPASVTEGNSPGVSTVHLTIPLTDKLQEIDRSLDLMFFADLSPETLAKGKGVEWQLLNLEAAVEYDLPTWPEFKNYARSILKRERAL